MILRAKHNFGFLDIGSREGTIEEQDPFRLALKPGQVVSVADKYRKLRNIDTAISQGLLEVISYDPSPGVEVIQDKASKTVETLDGTKTPGTGYTFSLGTHKHDGGGGTGSDKLGPPTIGDYSDGLFPWEINITLIADAAQGVNEILALLVPDPAPDFSEYNNLQTNGVTGKLSYDATHAISGVSSVDGIGNCTSLNVDIDFTYNSLVGMRRGIFSSSQTTFTGILASNVAIGPGSPSPSYAQYAFIDGNLGILSIYVNDDTTPKHTVDLTVFAFGNSLNANGTGFTDVSAVTNELFPNGNEFDMLKYRTAKWIVDDADLREGWNWIRITHTVGAVNRPLVNLYCDFVRDLNTTATAFSGESLTGFVGSGSKYLSGVNYFTGGSAIYAVTIGNLYLNTYYSGSDAITYSNNGTYLQTIVSDSLAACVGDENKIVTIGKTVNVIASGVRIINSFITVKTTAKRTVQPTVVSTGSSVNNILLDNVASSSTVYFDSFDDENYRLLSNISFDDKTQAVTGTWISTTSIADVSSVGYNDGLQVINGTLIYPSIDYSTIANGPLLNVDYSIGVTGIRSYYRFFNLTGSGSTGNFSMTVTGTAIPRANSYVMTNGTNDIKIDIKLPNNSGEGTGWLDCTAWFATNQWLDGNGCLLTGAFLSTDITGGIAKPLTVGIRSTGSTSVSGKVFIRIRVPQAWTGVLNSINLVGA